MEVRGSFRRAPPQHTVLKRWRGKKPYDKHVSSSSEPKPQPPPPPLPSPHVMKTKELAEWDPTTLPDNFFLVLVGKRRTGKSTFAKWLLQYYKDRFILVWCMTNTKANGYWQKFVGDAYTFSGYNPGAIWTVIKRNDKLIKQYGEESDKAKELGSVLIILDDVIAGKVHDDEMFTRLAVEGRHHLISVILMTQDPKAIGPKVRDNCDIAVIFNQKTFRNKESVWRDFMNDTSKDQAFAFMGHYAQEHNCLVSVQTNLNSDISKCFFKSTGDKTELDDPDYILGGETQKKVVEQEREKAEFMKEPKKQAAKYAKENPGEIHKLSSKEILKGSIKAV